MSVLLVELLFAHQEKECNSRDLSGDDNEIRVIRVIRGF